MVLILYSTRDIVVNHNCRNSLVPSKNNTIGQLDFHCNDYKVIIIISAQTYMFCHGSSRRLVSTSQDRVTHWTDKAILEIVLYALLAKGMATTQLNRIFKISRTKDAC